MPGAWQQSISRVQHDTSRPFFMRHPTDGERTIVTDTGNTLSSAENNGEFARAIADFNFNCRDARTWFHRHTTNLSAHLDSLAKRHVAERHEFETLEFFGQTFGNERIARLFLAAQQVAKTHISNTIDFEGWSGCIGLRSTR